MKRRDFLATGGLSLAALALSGCGSSTPPAQAAEGSSAQEALPFGIVDVTATNSVTSLDDGLSLVRVDGDDGFAAFLAQGGAASDAEVVQYLAKSFLPGALVDFAFPSQGFGCSALAVQGENGARLFGRNFDWYNCEALIAENHPAEGYASLSTVNTSFITSSAGSVGSALLQGGVLARAAVYAPLDGMNKAGLCVSVNMIEDSDTINQRTGKTGLTTTTAVRLLLNEAADVDEAVELLGQYDLHASFGYMVHFALTDAAGKSVAVEYIKNEMVVTETPVVTNFYLAEGEKKDIGTQQSHIRAETLQKRINKIPVFSVADVAAALESVSKHHYNDGETTEWSAVFDQQSGEAWYFHRENYEKAYHITLEGV